MPKIKAQSRPLLSEALLKTNSKGTIENHTRNENLGEKKASPVSIPLKAAKRRLIIYIKLILLTYRPQHFLYFLLLPQGQGSFRPAFLVVVWVLGLGSSLVLPSDNDEYCECIVV